ncbi:MAG: hypothetical protein COT17_04065 [Elusimicrobia bacterium CG08_land_8_20_14_0_20_51_18]|nr:MAG: hypothetical protein COT17_04065 [Elusimicrobia bacterium CG08_land_8_20_14_0_20_51_18]
MATNKKMEKTVTVPGKGEITIRPARIQDMRRIQVLYAEIYGASYSVTLITDKEKMRYAIEHDDYYWLVAEFQNRIIGSLVYAIDLKDRISKAFGAVVSQEFRKHDLAYTMMKLVLDDITHTRDLVDLVYATTRTASSAPQRLTESLGFIKLGIFPNTHKVSENETHCLTAYMTEKALKKRRKNPRFIPEIRPFYEIVLKQLKLDKPSIEDYKSPYSDHKQKIPTLAFEMITAPGFVKNRYKSVKREGFFAATFMPFHEPNLIFVTLDGKTEIYLHYNTKDKYSVVMGGFTDQHMTVVLDSLSQKLNELNMSYVEVIVDAYSPEYQRMAVDARFIPTGYFPCSKRVGNRRYDCIVFSRTFEILDFRNVKIISLYRNILKEYLKLWRENYVEVVFKP